MYIANYENVSLYEISPFTATRLSGDMQPSAWREKTFWSCCFCFGEGLVLHMEKPLSSSSWPQVNAGWPWQHVGHFECDPAHVGPWVMLFLNVLTLLDKITVSQLTFCTLWLQTNCKLIGLQVDIHFWWVVHTLNPLPPNYSIWIFTHLKRVKIIQIWQHGGQLFSNIADIEVAFYLSLTCLKGGT